MSPSNEKKPRRNPAGTLPLNVDVLLSLREMVNADAKLAGQHNMRARLVTLGLEVLGAIDDKERQTLGLRCVHRGDDDTARAINADLWPVAAVRGLDALPERSRDLLVFVLNDPELRQTLAAWLDGLSGRPPSAPPPGGGPAAPPPPPPAGGRRSSSRTPKSTRTRKGR